jgi:hypothetical protein
MTRSGVLSAVAFVLLLLAVTTAAVVDGVGGHTERRPAVVESVGFTPGQAGMGVSGGGHAVVTTTADEYTAVLLVDGVGRVPVTVPRDRWVALEPGRAVTVSRRVPRWTAAGPWSLD